MNHNYQRKRHFFICLMTFCVILCTFILKNTETSADAVIEAEVGDVDSVAHVNSSGWVLQRATWTISDPSVLKKTNAIGQQFYYTALKPGTATITFSGTYYTKHWNSITGVQDYYYNSIKTSWTIKVVKKTTSLSMKDSATINKGKGRQLTCTVKPAGASTNLTWRSSDTSVATVNKTGWVTGIKPGTAWIYARSASGIQASCLVTVKSPASKVKLASSSLSLGKKDTWTLSCTVTPSDCTDKVKWSSSKTSVATVNSKGKITAKKPGKTTITVRCGSKKAKCTVTVKSSRIKKITSTKKKVTLIKGKSTKLKYKLSPSRAGGTLKWSSSNPNVIKVDQKGKVTALKTGKASITAKASSGAKIKYTVTSVLPATGIKLNYKELSLGKGRSFQLTATASPSGTTDKITWKSGNSSIVSVTSSGKITGVKTGTTWIQAKAGSYSAKCTVTVKDEIPATSLGIVKTDPAVKIGETLTLTPKLGGSATMTDTASSITWKSSNSSVASVSSSGVVTGNSEGMATITASLRGMTAKYKLVVTKGAWVDVSQGTGVKIYNTYAVVTGISYRKISYNSYDGLTLVQSDPAVLNTVDIKGSANDIWTYVILGNITLSDISMGSGCQVIFETMAGTENYIPGPFYGNKLLFQGTGTLHIKTTSNARCIEGIKLINIKSGTIYIDRTHSSHYALYTQEALWIHSGAKVYVQGTSNVYHCADYGNFIDSGTLFTGSSSQNTELTSLQLSGQTNSLPVGSTLALTCKAYYSSSTTKDVTDSVTWTSSSSSVASVSSSGLVTAKAAGTTTIKASYGGKTASFTLKVTDAVDLSKGTLYIYKDYYTIGLTGEEVSYNPAEGIRLIQSQAGSGTISIEDSGSHGSVRLILTGVDFNISGSLKDDLILEMENGTVNSTQSTLYFYGGHSLTIQGNGTLNMTCDGFAVSSSTGGVLVNSGKVNAICTNESYYTAFAVENFYIADGAQVSMQLTTSHEPSLTDSMAQYITDGKLTLIQN